MRRRLESVVTVQTEERELVPPRRCCSATAGGSPAMSSTFGAPVCCSRRRAYGATDSKYPRCAPAQIVPNAREDLPDPDTPVNTASALRGMATSMSRRLFSRAPRTRTQWSGACGLVPFVLMGAQAGLPEREVENLHTLPWANRASCSRARTTASRWFRRVLPIAHCSDSPSGRLECSWPAKAIAARAGYGVSVAAAEHRPRDEGDR